MHWKRFVRPARHWHNSSVGAVAARCNYAEAGVGACASQNITDPTLGPGALALISAGPVHSAGMKLIREVSWLVAGKWFRPPFERLVSRLGYTVPEMTKETMITVAAMLRITPGTPFPLQNYLLGLARMPFGWYMAVSLPLNLSIAFSIVWFGDALIKGNATMILLAFSVIIAVILAVRQLRARLKRKSLDPKAG